MIDLKAFRKANDIRQQELADWLGIGQGYVSQMENGERPIPESIEAKILSNDRGWKTDFVLEEESRIRGHDASMEVVLLRKEVAALREQVKELREEKASYWAVIERLTQRP